MEQRRFIIKAWEIAEQAQPFSHPWNPKFRLPKSQFAILV